MRNFEYAQPKTEADAIEILSEKSKSVAVLAGGTDLVGLMKRMVISPERVVNISEIATMRDMHRDESGDLWVGAAVHLDEFLHDATTDIYPSVKQVIQGISSIQLQSQGTIVGELLRRPCCWYFRAGHDLLAGDGRMVVEGDNRYHAILGNRGAAKFVSASRLAPALLALGARVRIIGPEKEKEEIVDLEALYRTPTGKGEQETTLSQGQLVTHLILPHDDGKLSAAYEIRHGEGPDQPLVSAAASMKVDHGFVTAARIVMGQVAPVPWISHEAVAALIGRRVTEETATSAGIRSVQSAMALSQNAYKIDLAKVAVKRAILRAAGLETGGLESCPTHEEPALFA